MRRCCLVLALALWSAALGAATFTVTTNADSGAGSLRQAILDANAAAGTDTIDFAIGSGPQSIALASNLPTIFEAVLVDAWTQPGFAGVPLIEVNGGGTRSGFRISTSNATVRGFVVNRCTTAMSVIGSSNVVEGNYIGTNAAGTAALANTLFVVFVSGSNNRIGGSSANSRNVISGNTNLVAVAVSGSGNVIQGNYIGTDANGTAAIPNGLGINVSGTSAGTTIVDNVISGNTFGGVDFFGAGVTSAIVTGNKIGTNTAGTAAVSNGGDGIVVAQGSANHRIGGTTAAESNVISGNLGDGIFIDPTAGTGHRIEGNSIGTNAAGTAAIGNGRHGVVLGSPNNTVGGTTAGAGNVISGNGRNGIDVISAGNAIAGNLIGTNAAGTAAVPNNREGIALTFNAANNTVGGTAAGARNVISSNGSSGILVLDAASTGNTITGNLIGTDISGTVAIGNQAGGILISNNAANTTIGGTSAAARNVISGNVTFGLHLSQGATGTVVQGNYIGTDVNGALDLGNTQDGVELLSVTNHTIGGTAAGEGNVISGNNRNGIRLGIISTASSGNVIAGNRIGTNAAGTAAIPNLTGVRIESSASNTTIGGLSAAARNVISGNQNDGVLVNGSDNLIQGNFIGVDASGAGALGNGGAGVLNSIGSRNPVGGTAPGAANTIRFNGTGVIITAGTRNAIRRNSIASNTALGIDLFIPGVTPNDPSDADSGGNNVQNFPLITSALLTAGTTVISGTLNSQPATTFDIEIFDNTACDGSGKGEGLTFAGATSTTTDAIGNGTFSVTIPGSLNIVTATATDPNGNTSEFSDCAIAGINVIAISDALPVRESEQPVDAVFNVTVSPAPTVVTTVQYATADNTATAPADYTSTSGTLTFNPGVTTLSIAVAINNDNIFELGAALSGEETFFVNLTNPTNASISDAQGVGTIHDDEPAGIFVNDVFVHEGTAAVFTITMPAPADMPMSANYATANATAVAPDDYTAVSGTVTFAPGETSKTVSVPTLIDATTETDETFNLNLTGFFVFDNTGVATLRDISLIPALSTWMLMLLAAALAAAGLLLVRK
jgi:hypothetical protein